MTVDEWARDLRELLTADRTEVPTLIKIEENIERDPSSRIVSRASAWRASCRMRSVTSDSAQSAMQKLLDEVRADLRKTILTRREELKRLESIDPYLRKMENK